MFKLFSPPLVADYVYTEISAWNYLMQVKRLKLMLTLVKILNILSLIPKKKNILHGGLKVGWKKKRKWDLLLEKDCTSSSAVWQQLCSLWSVKTKGLEVCWVQRPWNGPAHHRQRGDREQSVHIHRHTHTHTTTLAQLLHMLTQIQPGGRGRRSTRVSPSRGCSDASKARNYT